MACVPIVVAAEILRVDASVTGGLADGSSWPDAFGDLQEALAAAQPGDEIWVARGMYRPGPPGNRAATFSLRDGVVLYGGFPPGGGDGSREARDPDPSTNRTVLSGDLAGDDRDLDGNGIAESHLHIQGEDNAHTVVSAAFTGPGTRLDGFTITAGSADQTVSGLLEPAAAGGALHARGSTIELSHVAFLGNRATGLGGAIFAIDGRITLEDCRLADNLAEDSGGAVYVAGVTPLVFRRVEFFRNYAYGRGGAAGLAECQDTVMDRCRFNFNATPADGGALYLQNTIVSITRSALIENFATDAGGEGGGIFSTSGRLSVQDTTFFGNTAAEDGGAVSIFGTSRPTFLNVAFVGNQADQGGAVAHSSSGPVYVNVTFTKNGAETDGGAIYNNPLPGPISPEFTNVIFWDNDAEGITHSASASIFNAMSSVARISTSLVANCGNSGPGWDASIGIDLGGNIEADPLFARTPDPGPTSWYVAADNEYGNLRLLVGSPALDFGRDSADLDGAGPGTETIADVETDLAGDARIHGIAVDAGAYEGSFATTFARSHPGLPADEDSNANGAANAEDFAACVDPIEPAALSGIQSVRRTGHSLVLSFDRRTNAADAAFIVEASSQMHTWNRLFEGLHYTILDRPAAGDDCETIYLELAEFIAPSALFARRRFLDRPPTP